MTATTNISERLAALETNGCFATRFAIDADPQLYVEGAGEVSLPLTVQMAHRLCAVARPAHHGYKDQTRLDPRVRDTWEIAASELRFKGPEWEAALDQALVRIGRDLGLGPDAMLRAELHNLLVYAPGQFFSMHQDSEKLDGMMGTLVVTLPSSFTGGEFLVSLHGQTQRSNVLEKQLEAMAFYADCHHEVRPVKQGYRVALTWNLIADSGIPLRACSEQEVDALAEDIRRFWQAPPAPRWPGDTRIEPPDRLVYLLDHQYTPSGFSWGRLKGVDLPRVAALRQAAKKLEAEIFLALADVHETWTAEDEGSYSRWEFEEDGDEEFDSDTVDHTLGELIDSEVELRYWRAPDGGEEVPGHSFVTEAELCLNRDSVDCTPFKTEYEGYMGNYGNTLDRWYHRAAVVMWPRDRAFVIRARQAPLWAMEQIVSRFDAGEPAQALEMLERLLPFWKVVARSSNGAELFASTLAVACELDDASNADILLAPFTLVQLTPEMGSGLLRLLDRHGLTWCMERLHQWAHQSQREESWRVWMEWALPRLVRILISAKAADGANFAAGVVLECCDWLSKSMSQIQLIENVRASARLKALEAISGALWGVFQSGHMVGDQRIGRQMIEMLSAEAWPIDLPLGVLRAAEAGSEDGSRRGLAPVHAYCMRVLEAYLARPERSASDWAIEAPAGRAALGELADSLLRFLASSDQRQLEWPLAQGKRETIHRFIDLHELPVRHETRRSGRPYTLVLEKTSKLFEREVAERKQRSEDLAWLRQVVDLFA